jgi:adenine-specific DNA glycosylase
MASPKLARQKKREIHYALQLRNRNVFLVQRARDANLMAGMWELPEVDRLAVRAKDKKFRRLARNDDSLSRRRPVIDGDDHGRAQPELLFTLKHSITVTDYTVHVWRRPASEAESGRWIASRQLNKLAVTGLTRKILRRSGLMV